jgi:orotate phosphoribosyltransferase
VEPKQQIAHSAASTAHAVSGELARSVPAVVGTAIAGITLSEWVALATLGYIVIQAAYLLRKWWREERTPTRYRSGGRKQK